jgi:hypothetical protein
VIDRLMNKGYKTVSRYLHDGGLRCSAGSINLLKVVMTMMRLVMEAVMIIAIVSGMVFVTKISASENNSNNTVRDNENERGDADQDSKESDNP